jgi:peptidoglycan/LPS O-acetylase OafA/YrhL
MSASRPFYPRLNGLRAVAVSLVLIHHFGGSLAGFWDQGYYGVDLFFVISGYLITGILLDSRGTFREAYIQFVGRRTLRIFPVYYAALLILWLLDFGGTRDNLLWLATYTWNYARDRWDGSRLFYLWSLSVEEQFYLFWPVLVLMLRRSPRWLWMATAGVIAVGYGQLLFNILPALKPWNYTGLINRMGSLGLGALGAVLIRSGWKPERLLNSLIPELLVWAVLVWAQFTDLRVRFPVMGVCSLMLVLKAVHGRFRFPGLERLFDQPVVQHLGTVSYGIYVYHFPLGRMLEQWLFDPLWLSIPFDSLGPLARLRWHAWVIKLPLFSAVTWMLASASYRWFEKPLLRLKDVWFPAASGIDQSPNATASERT